MVSFLVSVFPMKIKRYLYLTHRWFGVAMCLLFAMWFFSGMVMIYVGFPQLSQAEKFSSLPTLDISRVKYAVTDLLADLPDSSKIDTLKLTTVAGRPIYLLRTSNASWFGRYADTGERLTEVSKAVAKLSAKQFVLENNNYNSTHDMHYQTLLEIDQWSVSSSLNDHRPLHLINLNDVGSTQLYISSVTGEVVRDTSGLERIWNWMGANLHWIYPFQLRRHTSLWVDVVVVLSLLGLVSVISGAVIGLIRMRVRKPYRGNTYTPYKGVMKYHHLLGLWLLIFLTTYMFSGLMSMNPWNIFSEKSDSSAQIQRYQLGGEVASQNLAFKKSSELVQLLNLYNGEAIKEITWHRLGGRSYVVLHSSELNRDVVMPNDPVAKQDIEAQVRSVIPLLIPTSDIGSIDVLEKYDAYYYSHHGALRSLPALRVKFLDDSSTWFHIDLNTGQVVNRLTTKGRVQRWLYNGLHSFDFNFLIQNRPLWDMLVFTLCVPGLFFSLTAVVIAFKRSRRSLRINVSHAVRSKIQPSASQSTAPKRS